MAEELPKTSSKQDREILSVLESIRLVRQAGFGEVRVLIRNGAIYRVLKTEDKFIDMNQS